MLVALSRARPGTRKVGTIRTGQPRASSVLWSTPRADNTPGTGDGARARAIVVLYTEYHSKTVVVGLLSHIPKTRGGTG